jgi:nucleoside 2-deoxyribosyltransferase
MDHVGDNVLMPHDQSESSCPVCGLATGLVKTSDYGERLHIDCRRCGRFVITDSARAVADRKARLPQLSAWVRTLHEQGSEPPLISTDTWKHIEADLPAHSVNTRALLLLEAIARRSRFPGDIVEMEPEFDYPLVWGTQPAELEYFANHLMAVGLVEDGQVGPRTFDETGVSLVVTPAGWERLDDARRAPVLSDQAFVAMSFSSGLLDVYQEAIAPAIKAAGYRPHRVDQEPHVDRIDVRIMAEIRRSRFLIADVTEQKKGVYFEAGFALGLGIPVIWAVRKDDLGNVHFDTRQYNHIVWESVDGYRDQLRDFVTAIVGTRSQQTM